MQITIFQSGEKVVTFDFFGGFNILRVPLDGADESTDVWEVHLTADKVLQALQAVLELSAWPRLQMVNFSFKCLKYNQAQFYVNRGASLL